MQAAHHSKNHNYPSPNPTVSTLVPTRLTFENLLQDKHLVGEAKTSVSNVTKLIFNRRNVLFGKWILAHEEDEKRKNETGLKRANYLILFDKDKPEKISCCEFNVVVNQAPDYTMWLLSGIFSQDRIFSQYQLIRENEEYRVVPTPARSFSGARASFSRRGNAAVVVRKNNRAEFPYLRNIHKGEEVRLPDKNRQQQLLELNYRFITDSHLFTNIQRKKAYAIFFI